MYHGNENTIFSATLANATWLQFDKPVSTKPMSKREKIRSVYRQKVLQEILAFFHTCRCRTSRCSLFIHIFYF